MQPATGYDRNYSIMLIAFISYDNWCITKASANAQQLEWLLGLLLYNVGGQDLTLVCTRHTETVKRQFLVILH